MSIKNYPILNLKETNDSLEKILPHFDLVFVAGSSTAALDAYIAGLKVIVFLDSRDFNYSPVRGFDDVMFISTSREIKEILELKEISVKKKSIAHFFWMEKGLPKWRLFLKS
jgi:surface carbohydrate biosynthesis protein (TIGR04326 family)